MGLAPLSDTFGVVGVTEVIAVGGLAQPARLAGPFAGLPALRSRAILLAGSIAVIRIEQPFTVEALAVACFGLHPMEALSGKDSMPPGQAGRKSNAEENG
jgi:hypothetical protein